MLSSSELKSCILAMMYGDGSLDINRNSGKAKLDIYHNAKHYNYLVTKANILKQVTGLNTAINYKIDDRILVSGLTRQGYRLQTNFSSYLYNLSVLPFKYIAKQLVKPRALAILWQDDGTLSIHNKDYDFFSSAVLCTDSWSIDEIQEFQKAFNNRYGWCPVIMETWCRGNVYYRLRFTKDKAITLSNIISLYVLPEMEYKLISL